MPILKMVAFTSKGELVMQADEIGVPGGHNVENALATIAVAKIVRYFKPTIKETLSSFGGVKSTVFNSLIRSIM